MTVCHWFKSSQWHHPPKYTAELVDELPVKAGRIKTDRAVRISNVANEWVNGDF